MALNVEKMRFDIEAERKRQDWESRKFLMQALATGAACLAAGAGLATLFLHLAGKI